MGPFMYYDVADSWVNAFSSSNDRQVVAAE